MAEKNGVYYRPTPGERVNFTSLTDLWWEKGWGNGPFKVLSVRKPRAEVCTCGIETFESPHMIHHGTCERVSDTEVLMLETPLGPREVSGDWFEVISINSFLPPNSLSFLIYRYGRLSL